MLITPPINTIRGSRTAAKRHLPLSGEVVGLRRERFVAT